MIRPLAAFLHAIEAARTAGTLSRTVLVLGRQLDNAHLLAASEGARADRAEYKLTLANERVAELERALTDWREASGELAAEQPADDALPDLTDAGEAPVPIPLTNPAREAEIQQDRADALQRALQACEVDLVTARAQLRQTEAAAGAHIATISALREAIAAAHRAAHAPAPAEQIPGVAAADDPPCLCGHDAKEHGREGCQAAIFTGEVCACERFQRYGHHPRARATAADDPPPTRPSERTATRTT